MAVTLNSDAQAVFFTKVLGATHAAISKVKALIDTGVTFEVSLYAVRAYGPGKKPLTDPVQLSFGTTALMKGTVQPEVLLQNQKLIVDWVNYLYEKQGKPVTVAKVPVPPPFVHLTASPETVLFVTGVAHENKLPLIKAVHKLVGGTLAEAKAVVVKAAAGEVVKLATYGTIEAANAAGQGLKLAGGNVTLAPAGTVPTPEPVKAKPVDSVVHLKDAKALGQKVHGTSTGSVYYTIALSEHVRVAARITGGSISIRTEWTDNPQAELAKLVDAGIAMKQGYGSVHFDAAGVPVQRVIGAFLIGTGIDWKAMVTNGSELVVS